MDILFHDYYEIMNIRVGESESFNATGHFPILAGHDESGHPLYCAQSIPCAPKFSACVADGSSNAVGLGECGELESERRFDVAVLRFDPSD